MYLKHVITAGILSAALALAPGAAFAQTSGSRPHDSSQGSSSTTTSPSGSSSSTASPSTGSSTAGAQAGTTSSASSAQHQGSGASGADQEAVRQHLSAAREALAELTKLPAASQLQGEQRQRVAQLISDFNSFATATTDWRSKYDTVDQELDQILGVDKSASASGTASASPSGVSGSAAASTGSSSASPSASASTTGSGSNSSSGAVGTSGSADASSLDPAIVAKLREVRTHLDQFEEASGDPTFVVEKIEKILDQASHGASGSAAVGTSGTDSSASAGGSVTLTAAQVQELRRQLDTIKAAAKR